MDSAAPRLTPALPLVEVASRAAWRAWLAEHADDPTGVWAVTVKKSALAPGEEHVSAQDLNEECLCVGWIDSKPGAVDERRTALLCTPRKPGSGWSRVNKERIERLSAEGAMTPRGLAVIEAAKADGSWTKLDAVETLELPEDLAAALDALPPAREKFEAFPRSARRGILEWISLAKRAETRAARIATTAELAQRGERALQWSRRAE